MSVWCYTSDFTRTKSVWSLFPVTRPNQAHCIKNITYIKFSHFSLYLGCWVACLLVAIIYVSLCVKWDFGLLMRIINGIWVGMKHCTCSLMLFGQYVEHYICKLLSLYQIDCSSDFTLMHINNSLSYPQAIPLLQAMFIKCIQLLLRLDLVCMFGYMKRDWTHILLRKYSIYLPSACVRLM